MMAILNAKERGRDDWADLYREADTRFRFIGVKTKNAPGAQMSFMEASWEGHDAI